MSTDHRQGLEIRELVTTVFSDLSTLPSGSDWNMREDTMFDRLHRELPNITGGSVPRDSVYLGGDSLRPYIAVQSENRLWVVSKNHSRLSIPRLLEELDSGRYGLAHRIVNGRVAVR